MTRAGTKRGKRKMEDEVVVEIIENDHVGRRTRSNRRKLVKATPVEESTEVEKKHTRSKNAKIEAVKIIPNEDVIANDDSGSSSQESLQSIEKRLEKFFSDGDREALERYLLQVESEGRDGVKLIIKRIRSRLSARDVEEKRLYHMLSYEREAIKMHDASCQASDTKPEGRVEDVFYIVGVDEVGVGPLAGPIVSCAVAFHYSTLLEKLHLLVGIDDSKKLSISKRNELSRVIQKDCCAVYNFGIVTSKEVDELNPLQGSLVAMGRAVTNLKLPKGSLVHVLVDHHTIPNLSTDIFKGQTSITKGDSKSIAIAAASIVAKVYRDDYMLKLHQRYPNFGFDRNAGYGTAQHLQELRKGILCPEHRLSYEPVRVANRKALGLAPEDPPKKKSRASKVLVESSSLNLPTKSYMKQSPNEVEVEGIVKEFTIAADTPSIFSSAWWTSWFRSDSI